jgi:hypothetical protein
VSVDVGSSRREAQDRSSFFFWMSAAFVAIAFTGFARTYLIPVATNTFEGPALVHAHGALFFAWTLLVVVQTRLVARRRVDWHRALGIAGASLAVAMILTAVGLVARGLASPVVAANPSFGGLAALPLTQMALFAGFLAAGIVNVRRPETHKRCMLLATVNLLAAPIARILGTIRILAMGVPQGVGIDSVTSADIGARLTAALGGMVAIDLIVLVAILHDRRTLGRVHRVYVIGITAMLLTQVLRMPLAQTTLWRSFTEALAALGN